MNSNNDNCVKTVVGMIWYSGWIDVFIEYPVPPAPLPSRLVTFLWPMDRWDVVRGEGLAARRMLTYTNIGQEAGKWPPSTLSDCSPKPILAIAGK